MKSDLLRTAHATVIHSYHLSLFHSFSDITEYTSPFKQRRAQASIRSFQQTRCPRIQSYRDNEAPSQEWRSQNEVYCME